VGPQRGERLSDPLFLGPHLSRTAAPQTRLQAGSFRRADLVRACPTLAEAWRFFGPLEAMRLMGAAGDHHAQCGFRDRDGIEGSSSFAHPRRRSPGPIVSSSFFGRTGDTYAIPMGGGGSPAGPRSTAGLAMAAAAGGAGGDRRMRALPGFATASARNQQCPLPGRRLAHLDLEVLRNRPAPLARNIPELRAWPAAYRPPCAQGATAQSRIQLTFA